jgi:hypothetical protein
MLCARHFLIFGISYKGGLAGEPLCELVESASDEDRKQNLDGWTKGHEKWLTGSQKQSSIPAR